MKKKILLILVLLLAPILVLAENVAIKSVKLVDKSKYVEELSEPTFEGLKMSFDLKFNSVGDNATYELVVKNDDSENYFLNLSVDSDSKYILYELDSNEATNVVKANKETKIYVVVKYNKEVPNYMLENNKYTESKDLGIKLTNNKGEEVIVDTNTKEEPTKNVKVVVNPNTGNIVMKLGKTNIAIPLYVVVLVLGVSIAAIVLIRRNKVQRYTMILLVLLSVPVMISALKEIKIVVTSNIEIEKVNIMSFTFRDYYDYGNPSKYKSKKYDFEEGMTFEEWLDSKYNVDNINILVEEATDTCKLGYYSYVPINKPSLKASFNTMQINPTLIRLIDAPYDNDDSMINMQFIYVDDLKDEIVEDGLYAFYYEDCLVHFTIKTYDEKSDTYTESNYTASIGMTWGEWLDSEYNVDNIEFEDAATVINESDAEGKTYLNSDDGSVFYDDIINYDYYYEFGTFKEKEVID